MGEYVQKYCISIIIRTFCTDLNLLEIFCKDNALSQLRHENFPISIRTFIDYYIFDRSGFNDSRVTTVFWLMVLICLFQINFAS